MKILTPLINRFKTELVNKRIWKLCKNFYWGFLGGQKSQSIVLLILGCQRSGTTMVLDCFERDFRSTTFSEMSAISQHDQRQDKRFCLRPLNEVKNTFKQCKTPLIVAKPICDSQRCHELLAHFESSKAIWIFRHYLNVVNSNVKTFRAQVANIKIIVENELDNWRSEKVSDACRIILSKHYSPQMSREDAAALFWYVRNMFFFELELDRNPNVMLCKYEDLVFKPRRELEKVYQFLKIPYPRLDIVSQIRMDAFARKEQIILKEEISNLCNELWERLNKAYEKQKIARY